MKELIHSDISYKILGTLFDVYNNLGFGFQEKYYCRAIRESFRANGINFKEQLFVPVKYKDKQIGKYFIDFLVEDGVVLEVKRGNHFLKSSINQIYGYLKSTGFQLGILANFTADGIKFKRIVNIDQ